MLKVPGHIYSCNNLPNSGALEWPSGHGRTKILTKRGCVYFFSTLYPISWSLSILGCRNRAVEMASAGIE